jgi:hypothetical protein
MSGTSADGGFLTDHPPGPPSAEEVETALQACIAALAGLSGDLVRPRWQPLPPVQPDAATTWASVGVVGVEADNFPAIVHIGGQALPGLPNGYDVLTRHQTVTFEATFYGPRAEDCASKVRDALYLPLNLDPLRHLGLKLREVHDLARAPELVNQQWINRFDLRIDFRQQIDRIFAVLDLVGASVTVSDGEITSVADVP